MTDPVVWLRPEYQGREDELIHLAVGADLVGVTRSAVSNWANRHQNFPRIVMLVGPRDRRTKWVVRDEFLNFARVQLNKPRGGRKPGVRRPRAEILTARIAHQDAQVVRLAELEARQAAALDRTREALGRAKELAEQARRDLTAEIDAISPDTTH